MRRFLSSSLIILALVISAAGAAPAAHADSCTTAGTSCTAADGSAGNCAADPETNGYYCLSSSLGNATAANPGGSSVNPAAATPTTYTSPSSPYNLIMIKIMELFAWLLGVAALTLNYAAYYTVVTMGSYVHNLSAVGVTWRILRDIGNIMLIFGFLAVGITTILNVDWYGGGKKMLPMMLVAAVFLNFSLFISEAIIDTGNLFATQFYKQIVGGTLPTQSSSGLLTVTTTSGAVNLNPSNEGISNAIMSKLGLQTIYGNGRADPAIFNDGSPWLIGFMGIILFIIAAFVMFSLAFVLIARFVVLIFLIILAPVGFAGLAVPMLAKRAGQWWNKLFEQTITAPILLLMLYIALAVITDQQFLMGSSGGNIANRAWTGLIANVNIAGFASILLSFLVAMGLLLVVVIQSKNLSAFGAAGAIKLGGKLSFGATAFGLRSTAGWASNKIGRGLRNTRIGNRIATVPILGTNLTKAFEGIGKSSFDLRGAGALKNIGIDAGKAQEGGWNKWEEEKIKARMEYAKGFKGRELWKSEQDTASNAETERDSAQKSVNATKAVLEEDKKSLDRLDKDLERMKRMQEGMSEQDSRYEKLTQDITQKEKEKTTAETRSGERNTAHETAKLALTEAEQKLTAASNANKEITSGAAAQKKYAQNLTPQWLGKWGNYVINPYRNTQATKKILTEAKKSKTEKDLDSLKKLLEDNTKKEEKAEKPKEEGKKPEAAP